ncbi:MAG: hypothetical protein OQL27_10335 [Sedimenticola sp.]|nr:hypothetical protein [Sedimenticola sp.]
MSYSIVNAKPNDYAAILKVMEPWNLYNVPSAEMDELDRSCFFVDEMSNQIIGAAGYKLLSDTQGETTILRVLPGLSCKGFKKAIQNAMHYRDCHTQHEHTTSEIFLSRAIRLVEELQRPIATPEQIRQIIGLNQVSAHEI